MPHPSPAAFIEATGLIKHLGGHLVLNGASLRLLEGETLAVLGRSGDGKSVLLKHLAGLMMPESGSVRIDGDEIVGVELPAAVELTIAETEPGIQGDRVSGARKPATLETGLVIQVPLFVEPNERVKVDTRTGEYLTRA